MNIDEDAVKACADLVGRTGARQFQIGYLDDEPPCGWYAYAQYKGARISAEDYPGPVEAADALVRKLLTGARCKCGKLVALSDDGAIAYGGLMTDGSTWTHAEATAAGQCRWTRMGPRWEAGCSQGKKPDGSGKK